MSLSNNGTNYYATKTMQDNVSTSSRDTHTWVNNMSLKSDSAYISAYKVSQTLYNYWVLCLQCLVGLVTLVTM